MLLHDVGARAGRLGALIRRHSLFAAALGAGGLLRLIAMLGYPGMVWFAGDSYVYLGAALRPRPDLTHTVGYSFLLRAFEPLHSFVLVALVQHLMGLAMAVMVYALARRAGVPRWVATLATLPILLDGYEIQLEHMLMSDLLFSFLVMSSVTLVLWRDRPKPWVMLAAGLVIGYATVVREVGMPVIAVLIAYFLIRWRGWLVPVALAAGALVPVAGYAAWFDSVHGQYLLTRATGFFLWGRVTSFAECAKINPPARERPLCLPQPPAQRQPPGQLVWVNPAAYRLPGGRVSPSADRLMTDFAVRAIEAQPLSYAGAIAHGLWLSVDWRRHPYPSAFTTNHYLFPYRRQSLPAHRAWIHGGTPASDSLSYGRAGPSRVVPPFSSLIRTYQRYVYTYGPLFGLLLAIGLAGLARRWRRLGGPVLLPWAVAMTMLLFPIAATDFDYRYLMPVLPMAALAAALAFASMERSRRAPAAAPQPEAITGIQEGAPGAR